MGNSQPLTVYRDSLTGFPAAVPHRSSTNDIKSLFQDTHHEGYHNPGKSNSRTENSPFITESENLEGSKHAKPEPGKIVHGQAQIQLNKNEQLLNGLRQANAELEGKVQELKELQNLNKAILQKKNEELDKFCKLWKQACIDLNNFKAQGQRFYPVTDDVLTQKAVQLRFNIRNFADQQFRGELIDAKTFHSFWTTINEYLKISSDSFEACMKDSSGRPMIVGAFLWVVLGRDFFHGFCWAETQVSSAMSCLGQVLEPVGNETSTSDLEAKRKFRIWRATTATLVLDSNKLHQKDGHGASRRLNESKVHDICEVLSPFSKSKYKQLADQLFNIVNEALDLDKLVTMQAAEVIWYSHLTKKNGQFDQDLVRLQQGEKQTGTNGSMYMVTAPAMIRRGKSTGEDFDSETILLKMEVELGPRIIKHTGESDKTPSFIQRVYNTSK